VCVCVCVCVCVSERERGVGEFSILFEELYSGWGRSL